MNLDKDLIIKNDGTLINKYSIEGDKYTYNVDIDSIKGGYKKDIYMNKCWKYNKVNNKYIFYYKNKLEIIYENNKLKINNNNLLNNFKKTLNLYINK